MTSISLSGVEQVGWLIWGIPRSDPSLLLNRAVNPS